MFSFYLDTCFKSNFESGSRHLVQGPELNSQLECSLQDPGLNLGPKCLFQGLWLDSKAKCLDMTGRWMLQKSCQKCSFLLFSTLQIFWLWMLAPKAAIDLKLHSSFSQSVMGTAVGYDNHCQITVGIVTQPMTVNWL